MAEEAKNEQAKDQPKGKAKGGALRKVLKVFAWLVGIVLALVVLLIISTPLWLGPLAKSIANDAVPKLTGCEFKLEELSVNPFSGRVFLRECRLKNPEGYKKDEAFAVSTVVVDVAVCSLMTDEIHVETIEIRGLRASYLSDSKGVNNFERMMAHMDGKEPGAEPTEEEIAAKKAEEAKAEPPAEEGAASGPKVIIDHFEMTDSKISYGLVRGTPPITLPLPRVTLDGIGKDKEGGTTFADALSAIWNACLKVAGSAGEQVKKLGSAVGEAAGAAADAVGSAAGAAAGAVGSAAGAAAGAVGTAAGVVGDAAGAAAEAVGNAAGAAVDAVKSIGGLFKGDGKDDKKK